MSCRIVASLSLEKDATSLKTRSELVVVRRQQCTLLRSCPGHCPPGISSFCTSICFLQIRFQTELNFISLRNNSSGVRKKCEIYEYKASILLGLLAYFGSTERCIRVVIDVAETSAFETQWKLLYSRLCNPAKKKAEIDQYHTLVDG